MHSVFDVEQTRPWIPAREGMGELWEQRDCSSLGTGRGNTHYMSVVSFTALPVTLAAMFLCTTPQAKHPYSLFA